MKTIKSKVPGFVAVVDQPFAKLRAKKAGTAGDQHALDRIVVSHIV